MSQEYMGHNLLIAEIDVLKELENLMGSNWNKNCFSVDEQNHVFRIVVARVNLNKLPENIGNCKELKALMCYGNKIERLPNSIGQTAFGPVTSDLH